MFKQIEVGPRDSPGCAQDPLISASKFLLLPSRKAGPKVRIWRPPHGGTLRSGAGPSRVEKARGLSGGCPGQRSGGQETLQPPDLA